MRLFILLFVFFQLHILVGQNLDYVISEQGGAPFRKFPRINATVTIPNGDQLLLLDRQPASDPSYDMVLLRINTASLAIEDSTVLDLPGDQFGTSMVATEDNHIWVVGRSEVNEQNNTTDILLLELDENLELLNQYFYNSDRYESPLGLVVSSDQTISVAVGKRTTIFDPDVFEMVTFSRQDGSIETVVPLAGLANGAQFYPMASNGNGGVIIMSQRFVPTGFVTVNVISGTVESQLPEFPQTNCPNGNLGFGPSTTNIHWEEERSAYVTVDHCLQLFVISQDGTVEIIPTNSATAFGALPTDPAFIQREAETYVIHQGGKRFTISPQGDGYDLADQVEVPVQGAAVRLPIQSENNLTFIPRNSVSSVRVYNENSGLSTPFAAVSDRYPSYTNSWINRSIYFTGEEVLVGQYQIQGGNVLRFSANGTLLDTLAIDPTNRTNIYGFSQRPDGTYLAALFTKFGTPRQLNLVSFSMEEGMLDTVLSITDNSIIDDIFRNSATSPSGTLYFSYFKPDDAFGLDAHTLGVDTDGEIRFTSVVGAPVFTPNRFFDFAVDGAGNVHQFYQNEFYVGGTYLRFDSTGNLLAEIDFPDFGETISPILVDLAVNTDGTKIALTGSVFPDGQSDQLLIELDVIEGEVLRLQTIQADNFNNDINFPVTYLPGKDTILTLIPYYRDGNPDASELYDLAFRMYGPEGLLYEEVIYRGASLPNLFHLLATATDQVYAGGYIYNDSLNTEVSIFIGLDVDQVVSVAELPDVSLGTNLQVFPNPTTDLARVNWDNTLAGNHYELQLLTNDGRLLRRWLGELPVGRASLDVDMSQLPSGAYLLRLATDNGVVTERVVKQ